jgi:hypothetical protein
VCVWLWPCGCCSAHSNPTQTCTISGTLYEDAFSFGDLPLSQQSVRFGVINYQTDNFQQFYVVHGVIGMAWPAGSSLPNLGAPNPLQLLYQQNLLPSTQFAICLRDNAGKLSLGGPDPNLYLGGSFQQTPLVQNGVGLYTIGMVDLQVAGVGSVGLPPSAYQDNDFGGCVVDSGTNVLLLPQPIYQALTKAAYRACALGTYAQPHVCNRSVSEPGFYDGACFDMSAYSDAQLDQLYPPFTLVFNSGTQLHMKGRNYILRQNSGLSCLGVTSTGQDGFLIVGDTLMENYYTLFDVENQQVGWAPVNARNCFGS